MADRKTYLIYLFLCLHVPPRNCQDSITTSQIFKEGDVLVSKNGKFAFGFFSPRGSVHRYLGIWFHKISEPTVVWVANRNSPLNGSSGFLSIDQLGNLVLYNDQNQTIPTWTTNVSSGAIDHSFAQLLDSGNLVLCHGRQRDVLWQSFDYPTNTYLPGMKRGTSAKKGLDWRITSWRSENDPRTGDFSIQIDPRGTMQIFLYKGLKRQWRQHIWPHRKFSELSDVYNYSFVVNQEEAYAELSINDESIIIIEVVDHLGTLKWLRWSDSVGQWKEFWSAPKIPCDLYAHCGPYGKCTPGNPDVHECSCLPGYEPKLLRDWHLRDGSGGCVKKRMESSSLCNKGDGFLKVEDIKIPDTSAAASLRVNISHQECKLECLRDCSCTAYASIDNIESGNDCVTWHGELIDTVDHMNSNGKFDLYVRVDAIELAENTTQKHLFLRKDWKILVLAITSAWVAIMSLTYLWIRRKKEAIQKRREKRLLNPVSGSVYYKNTLVASDLEQGSHAQDILFFDLSIIVAATKNFAPTNIIGQGGFGTVYKGQLPDGKEVAIKRLSPNSGRGTEELKNEVMLIAKLQHRNLVKLLGCCCVERGEQMLVYEYLSNKSLDLFIFDKTRRSILDWKKRFDIIIGIARGILYLHQDSRLTIIHRDLKCSNILLDANMNPKIADFGIARIFRTSQIQEKTSRVVGTYGYMSPEYGLFGKFSAKSDVFSFGVILLEIVSAKKNNKLHKDKESLSLIEHVWYLWRQHRETEIVDSSLKQPYPKDEVNRCIQIGLLCVQEYAEDRPTMAEAVQMLVSDKALPSPKQPAFILSKSSNSFNSTKADEDTSCSINQVTVTSLASR